MPSTSQAMQQATAIALHEPGKLYKRNRGLLKMAKSDLHEYASTPRKGLPKSKHSKRTTLGEMMGHRPKDEDEEEKD